MIAFYVGMICATAIWSWLEGRPKTRGEWIGFIVIVLAWPFLIGFAIYLAIKDSRPA